MKKNIFKILIFLLSFLIIDDIKAENIDQLIPVGTIQAYYGTQIPNNYLIASGQSLNTTQYSKLFQAIGYTYGGSGTNFSLPNLNGRVIVGRSSEVEFNTIGKTGGESEHILTISEIPSHTHTFTANTHTHTFTGEAITTSTSGAHSDHTLSVSLSSAGAHYHNVYSGYGNSKANGALWYSQNTRDTGYRNSGHGINPFLSTNGAHTHSISATAATSGSHSHTLTSSGTLEEVIVTGTNATTGKGVAHNNLQPYVVVKYIIKVK